MRILVEISTDKVEEMREDLFDLTDQIRYEVVSATVDIQFYDTETGRIVEQPFYSTDVSEVYKEY